MTNRAVITASLLKEMTDGLHDSALIRAKNGALVVVPSLSKIEDSIPDTSIVLKTNAREWAEDLIESMREQAQYEGTSTHLATLRKMAVIEANAEIDSDDERSERGTDFLWAPVPHDLAGPVALLRQELRAWANLIDSLIPLLP